MQECQTKTEATAPLNFVGGVNWCVELNMIFLSTQLTPSQAASADLESVNGPSMHCDCCIIIYAATSKEKNPSSSSDTPREETKSKCHHDLADTLCTVEEGENPLCACECGLAQFVSLVLLLLAHTHSASLVSLK